MLWRKKQVPAPRTHATEIRPEDVQNADQRVSLWLDYIQTLQNIDQDEKEGLKARGGQIVREWASKGLEQCLPPSSQTL